MFLVLKRFGLYVADLRDPSNVRDTTAQVAQPGPAQGSGQVDRLLRLLLMPVDVNIVNGPVDKRGAGHCRGEEKIQKMNS